MRIRLGLLGVGALTVAAVTVGVALLAGPAGASAPPESDGQAGALRRVSERVDVPAPAQWDDGALGSWLWPEGRRLFLLAGLDTSLQADPGGSGLLRFLDWPAYYVEQGTVANRRMGYNELVALDLDSGERVGRVELDPAALWSDNPTAQGGAARRTPWGQQEVVAVDRERGRLFVAYGQNPLEPARYSGGSLRGCLAWVPCVGGVHVVDAKTLEVVGEIPLTIARVDGGPVAPYLHAMRYVPPATGEDHEGKVLLLVEDRLTQPVSPNPAQALVPEADKRGVRPSAFYLVQLDAGSLEQDWAVRASGCDTGRFHGSGDSLDFRDLPHAATLLRTFEDGRPVIWVGCLTGARSRTAALVRIPLDAEGFPPGEVPVEPADPQQVADEVLAEGPGAEPRPEWVARSGEGQQAWQGPTETLQFYADPGSGRVLLRSRGTGDELWWVFDTDRRSFLGAIGIGDYQPGSFGEDQPRAGFDEERGRLYVQTDRHGPDEAGVYVADVRGDPLQQALFFPEAEVGLSHPSFEPAHAMQLVVDEGAPDGATRVLAAAKGKSHFEVLVDALPARSLRGDDADGEASGSGRRTLDIAEQEGVSAASFDGAARGYGFRAILVGGLEAAARVGPADPGAIYPWTAFGDDADLVSLPRSHACSQDNREVVAAFVGPQGPATVDSGGSRGGAKPVVVDGRTRTDLEAPVSRCSTLQWDEVWSSVLFSRPPLSEPSAPWMFEGSQAECVSSDEPPEDSWTDELVGAFGAEVWCEDEEAGGRSEAQAFTLEDAAEGDLSDLEVSVTEAVARFHIYRDPERGLVARMESIARGVSIGDVVEIDTIRGSAEAWANGRAQPDTEADQGEGESFNPHNCDRERTAGSCFDRHLFGVHVGDGQGGTAYECGPCGDEQAAVEAIDARLGARGEARLRDPDPELARGTADGFQAGVVKPEFERFADLVLNADTLQTTVPTLEVIRYAPPSRPLDSDETPRPPPGRQVYQFAGVEAATTYAIECLLWYDEANNVCTDPPVDPADLTVELEDADGQPLAGGAFTVFEDAAGDGVLDPDADEAVRGGECVTDAEGVCTFEGLLPGAYLVEQAGASQGYAPVAEPFAVTLAPGVAQTVTFTNVADVATVAIELVDLDGAPIEGAEFALYPDVDGSGELPAGVETAGRGMQPLGDGVAAKTAAGDDGAGVAAASTAPAPVASCVTDAEGRCAMTVAPGPYVLVQTHTPEGFAPIEPIAFELAEAGQTAEVAVTNVDALDDGEQQAAPEPAPDLRVEDPPPAALPVINDGPSVAQPQPAPEAAQPALPEGFGGTIVRVLRAPGALARLAVRSPMEAAAFAGVWLIWLSAAYLIWRRHQLVHGLLRQPPGRGGPAGPAGSPTAPGGPGGSGGAGGPSPPGPSEAGGGGGAGPAGGRSGSQSDNRDSAQREPSPRDDGSGRSARFSPAADPPHPTTDDDASSDGQPHARAATAVLDAPDRPLVDEPEVGNGAVELETTEAIVAAWAADLRLTANPAPATEAPAAAAAGGDAGAGSARVASSRVVLAASTDRRCERLTAALAERAEVAVAATVREAEALPAALAAHRPDAVIIDLGLRTSDRDPEGLWELLQASCPLERTIGVIPADRRPEALAQRAWDLGVGAVLSARDDLAHGEVAEALGHVADGRTYLGSAVLPVLIRPGEAAREATLTTRELEVARLAAQGLQRSEIAARLFVEAETVKTHLGAARAKLGVHDPWSAEELRTRLAARRLLDGDDPA